MIITDPKQLRIKSEIVKPEEAKLVLEIKELLVSHLLHLKGFGLAAPQVGHYKRIIVSRINNELMTFVNPVIVDKYDIRQVKNGGCDIIPDNA